MKVGDVVFYHPIIGRKHTGVKHEIQNIGKLGSEDVAWISGKSGCVSMEALSLAHADV